MTEWIECKISDIGTVVGGATPSTKKPENYENGTIAWITPKDLSTFTRRYIQRGERNITEIGLKSCSTQLLPRILYCFLQERLLDMWLLPQTRCVPIRDLRVLSRMKIPTRFSYIICSNITKTKSKVWEAEQHLKKYQETQ